MKRSNACLILILVALVFAPSSAFAFGKNKIVYDRFDWKVYHSTHFDIYFYPSERESLQKVVNLTESAYDDISRKFNFQVTKKIPLIFYATHSAFEQNNVMLGFIPEGVGAFAEPARNRMVMPIDMPDQKLYSLIRHELTHVFEYEILFQGSLGRVLRANPPTWLMEGLASFMGEDEDTTDRMVLRDAVVNDTLPSVTQNVQGFFAYRFGHAVFRFMRDKWGMDGVRDFIYEYRNVLGSSVEKPLKRAFDISVEEFNSEFRTWLRKQYLPALVEKGEPSEYGERFIVNRSVRSAELSPVPAPSGDLMAALTTYKDDIDIVLFNVPKRKLLRNLTRGYSSDYEYIIGQFLTTGPVMGRDLAFSPDGDTIAFFAKKERGRELILINALTGRIERSIKMKVEQQLSPAFSPDGKQIAFQAFSGNQADIWTYDLSTGKLTNLTNDSFFDGAPTYSPDGKWLVYSSNVDGHPKLFRLDLTDTTRRFQLTHGAWSDTDAWVTSDGKLIFFASDRPTGRDEPAAGSPKPTEKTASEPATADSGSSSEASGAKGVAEKEPVVTSEAMKAQLSPREKREAFAAYNIYSLDMETGEVRRYTDVIGGAFTPVVFMGEGGKQKLVFTSYYKGAWKAYVTDVDKDVPVVEKIDLPTAPVRQAERTHFLAPVEVALDPDQIGKTGSFKLFVDNIDINAGVASDQTIVSRSTIYMSDMLGGRRFVASIDSVSTFSNFDFLYLDMRRRTSWGARLFDNRSYYIEAQIGSTILTRRFYRETGAIGIVSYPFNRTHRIDAGLGYESRSIDLPSFFGNYTRDDDFPLALVQFTGDSTVFKHFGPIDGRRYDVSVMYAPDLKNSGTLTSDYSLDFRQYYQVSSRSLLAMRIFGGWSDGNFPNFYYIGGLNTLRGYDFLSIVGNRAFYGNFEYRFPLIDVVSGPFIFLRNVRGSVFFDVGGAFFDGQSFVFSQDGKLKDGLAAVGYGVSFNMLGLELHWDFAKRTDLKNIDSNSQTSFWIGQTF